MSDELLQLVVFFLTAILGGAINSVAGGGTFLLFPVLIFGGLSAINANIMCCAAMWPGSVASSIAYWQKIKIPISSLKYLLIYGVAGSLVGAVLLLITSEAYFSAFVPYLLLAATLIFTFGRRINAFLRMEGKEISHKSAHIITIITMFLVALYGGYFGAGIGIIILSILQFAGYRNIHEMNGIKTILASIINAVAVLIFLALGNIDLNIALILASGGIIGGYFGTKLALRFNPEKARIMVILLAWIMTGYFWGLL